MLRFQDDSSAGPELMSIFGWRPAVHAHAVKNEPNERGEIKVRMTRIQNGLGAGAFKDSTATPRTLTLSGREPTFDILRDFSGEGAIADLDVRLIHSCRSIRFSPYWKSPARRVPRHVG